MSLKIEIGIALAMTNPITTVVSDQWPVKPFFLTTEHYPLTTVLKMEWLGSHCRQACNGKREWQVALESLRMLGELLSVSKARARFSVRPASLLSDMLVAHLELLCHLIHDLTTPSYFVSIIFMGSKGFFITGTDTGVGKTFITAGIAMALRGKGINVGVMKPVETGCSEVAGGLEPQDAILLKRIAGVDDGLELINPYRFKAPVAPSIAGNDTGQTIDLNKIKGCYEDLASRHDVMLVEGIGGLLVPLNERETVADLVRLLGLPLIVIVASRLGAINHTLLTVKYAQGYGIEVKGIILNYPELSLDEAVRTNKGEVKRLTGLTIIGELPFCDEDRSPEMVKRYLNLSPFLYTTT